MYCGLVGLRKSRGILLHRARPRLEGHLAVRRIADAARRALCARFLWRSRGARIARHAALRIGQVVVVRDGVRPVALHVGLAIGEALAFPRAGRDRRNGLLALDAAAPGGAAVRAPAPSLQQPALPAQATSSAIIRATLMREPLLRDACSLLHRHRVVLVVVQREAVVLDQLEVLLAMAMQNHARWSRAG